MNGHPNIGIVAAILNFPQKRRMVALTVRFRTKYWLYMNQKTSKLLKKYAEAKGISEKQMKREWLVLNQQQKDKKRQEILKELVK
ncbi:hypothetical protein CH373_01880 [Leptospira perolatii]|uniref:Uncharacterized protein n=1 Tax=Leptospira perolatii TaxID=2023191 RepID=A0A2M9ZRV4_9LEPT|nr:hypothetical protein [Leptospira perolatii]PJZ71276.1 hypothetical protein CH360_01880 [Leptospira perolatii]PJZ74810.1 hypothetical protein CH373_01880 [Leptospira perolatii]